MPRPWGCKGVTWNRASEALSRDPGSSRTQPVSVSSGCWRGCLPCRHTWQLSLTQQGPAATKAWTRPSNPGPALNTDAFIPSRCGSEQPAPALCPESASADHECQNCLLSAGRPPPGSLPQPSEARASKGRARNSLTEVLYSTRGVSGPSRISKVTCP